MPPIDVCDMARINYLVNGVIVPCDLNNTRGDSERESMFELIRVLLHLDIKPWPLPLDEYRSRRLCYGTSERLSRKHWAKYGYRISGPMRRAFLRYLYTSGDHLLLRNLGLFEETQASLVRLEKILVFTLHKRHHTLCTLPLDILKTSWKSHHLIMIQDITQYYEERELWLLIDFLLFYARRQYQGFYVYRMSIRQLVGHWNTMQRCVGEATPVMVPSIMMGLHVFGYLVQQNLIYGSMSTVTRGSIQAESERLPVAWAVPVSFRVSIHNYMVTPIQVNIPGRCLENHFSETVNNGHHFQAWL